MTAIEVHPPETIVMPFLSRFRFGRSRKSEDLKRRVAHLQTALRGHSEVAGLRAGLRRGAAGAIAVLMLGIGFTLGTYREPIQQTVIGFAQPLGLMRAPTKSDALDAVYQHRRYVTVMRMARPLAAEGDARAQSMLGLLYYRGQGVPQDHNEALRWFRQAADQDDVVAQFHLGVMLAKGQGVPQDDVEAANWFRRAADLGDAQAQYNLGIFYAEGKVGEPDNVSAHMWFNLAATHFPPSGTDDRTAAVRNRDLVAEKMTPAQIAQAQRRAREWRPKSN
jgi:hypothetical protein